MAAKQEPVFNTSGTHVYIHNPDTDGYAWVGPEHAAFEVERRGWEYAAPVEDPTEGVVDEAPKKPASKKAASSSKTPGD